MRILIAFAFIMPLFVFVMCTANSNRQNNSADAFTGSKSCIECHEQFYELWSTSHHGLAMQPITERFTHDLMNFKRDTISMEGAKYVAMSIDTTLIIREIKDGETADFEIIWALGGKNVYYFLTEMDGGKLQTLPLAFNVNTYKWYNNPASAIRHFPNMQHGDEPMDEALPWRHRQYTFNTACYSCHVSQLSNNYDLATNTYQTTWKEAGINCETCHGPANEHIKAALLAEKEGRKLEKENIGLIVTSDFTPEQHNASCAGCHAKMHAITSSYMPGEKYFDNFDLITLENSDFYPDGRDLGENYTMTSWHMNSCVENSDLHCVTCHTSSGRYRYDKPEFAEANKACTQCHIKREEDYEVHTHHMAGYNAPKCIECHMPKTTFGHMDRSDHSFRPPMPKATMAFESPNACNLCHDDKDAQWAQSQMDGWGKDDSYQNLGLDAGKLIVQARLGDWTNVEEIYDAIKTNKYGEVYTTSFLRLLANNNDIIKKDAALVSLRNESALVRAAAATTLYGLINDEDIKAALLIAAQDQLRLVRLSAAASLTAYPENEFNVEEADIIRVAMDEYKNSLISRPDDWSSHFNLGNFYQNLGQSEKAMQSYNTSLKIYPDAILSLVNSSYLDFVNGKTQSAEVKLKKALEIEPMNEAANFNYGLLMAELNHLPEAETALKNVVKVNNKNAPALYNLSIIVATKNINEAIELGEMAVKSDPENPKYKFSHAFYLNQDNQKDAAVFTLEKLLDKNPDYLSATYLLAQIYEEEGKTDEAINVYKKALGFHRANDQIIDQLNTNIERLND